MEKITPNEIETLCRAVCTQKGINPDGEGFGMGNTMPEGTRYKLWEAQKSTVMAVLEGLNHG